MTHPAAPSGADPLALKHQQRVRRLLVWSAALLGSICGGWTLWFLKLGLWLGAAVVALGLATGVTTILLVRCGRIRLASMLVLGLTYAILTFWGLFVDVTTPGAQRSVHQFLLGVATTSFLLMRDEIGWRRHAVAVVSLATWVMFSVLDVGWVSSITMSDAVRTQGHLVNYVTSALTLFVSLYVIQTESVERNAPAIELRAALARNELLLHYQPQITGTPSGDVVTGAEALVRWLHPKRGLVSPGEFVPLAESAGLMPQLGEWVMRSACARLAAWSRDPATASLTLAVNVSASHIAEPNFVARVLNCVKDHGVDPSKLKIELTESVLAHDLDDIIAKMTALQARGIGFSLDDFGTGFSSLNYLRRLPLDQLKIDQSFVRDLPASPSDAAIAQTIVDLGRSLGLNVIAEGVETDEQRVFLAKLGCRSYQGYFFSRPLAAEPFEAYIAAQRAKAAERSTDAAPLGL